MSLTHHQIDQALKVSLHTVKTHLDNIPNKLGLENRDQATVWVAKDDLV